MKIIALFGGSGGLGSQLQEYFQEDEYKIISISSKDVDIRNWKEVDKFFYKNDIDIVINLAGTNLDTMIHKYDGSKDSDMKEVLNVNIMGAMNILSVATKRMREKEYGRIILASSVLSNHTVKGTSIYSGTKAFIDSLVRTASAENISKGITVNSLRLGYFDGGMCHRLPTQFATHIKEKMIPLKRWGSIHELAGTLHYLINTEYITGQHLEISGGLI